jgi:putative aminopeptidase FrvX
LTIAKSDLKSISLIDDQCFGTFAFPDFKMKRSLIFARAADDLAGVVAILATFERLNTSQRKNMLAVFTRAEETGFRGALGFLYSQILGAKNMAISLEASRALEGAEISQGPVIRLGDRRSLFNSDVVSRLDFAAESLKKRGKKIQRRIMDGGVCEGTAFNFLGIKCGGLAIPLGNYHNQKPSGKPGPEFVCLNDLITEVDLCVEFYKNCEKKINPVKKYLTELEAGFKKDSSLLKRKISFKGRT